MILLLYIDIIKTKKSFFLSRFLPYSAAKYAQYCNIKDSCDQKYQQQGSVVTQIEVDQGRYSMVLASKISLLSSIVL
jgi:hypothetical protein